MLPDLLLHGHALNYTCTTAYGFKKRDDAHILSLNKLFVNVIIRNP